MFRVLFISIFFSFGFYDMLKAGMLSMLKDVEISSSVDVAQSYKIKNIVAFSSVPIMTFGGFNSTLGSGTTFSIFVPSSPIRLRGIYGVIVERGGNSPVSAIGDFWYCSDGINEIKVKSNPAAVEGTPFSNKEIVYINAGSTVSIRLQSGFNSTPSANITCEYSIQ